jgi:hypothetical protein
MQQMPVAEYLRETGLTPMVRPTRSDAEVEYLPPFGDPEVSIPGEVATYAAAGVVTVELLERFME